MIESTLTLKRFADQAVQHLCGEDYKSIEAGTSIDYWIQSVTEAPGSPPVAKDDLKSRYARRQIELSDAVRVGCKAGMGSRQNAPAEWIGE
jgi:cullin-4